MEEVWGSLCHDPSLCMIIFLWCISSRRMADFVGYCMVKIFVELRADISLYFKENDGAILGTCVTSHVTLR